MKYEVHKGFPISFKKYCDVKVEGYECSLYTSQLWFYQGSGVEHYSALIIPLKYKGKKLPYKMPLLCGFVGTHTANCLIDDFTIRELMRISQYDGKLSSEELKWKLYHEGFFKYRPELLKYSESHFNLQFRMHGNPEYRFGR
jgi:hypothetical protein